ncbi:MAG: hypothetical protein BRD49_04175 [Bacteroidetes bacterium SW_10_40_5]|nr:MAG: hypothetical protein BRD49_04175 [Bacteroidetes bacterium SW_10_40_5]
MGGDDIGSVLAAKIIVNYCPEIAALLDGYGFRNGAIASLITSISIVNFKLNTISCTERG